ncbi:MAG: hypothetical protein UV51_C0018G0005 [Candidatus Woesebacteria bacterium GW2011_GWC1_42_9]|nr:MAG: hypothetical protein UV51_C0018G0005 [Candidatus Woesebacteria bacterium GW2011_GWC1_42_9]
MAKKKSGFVASFVKKHVAKRNPEEAIKRKLLKAANSTKTRSLILLLLLLVILLRALLAAWLGML